MHPTASLQAGLSLSFTYFVCWTAQHGLSSLNAAWYGQKIHLCTGNVMDPLLR